MSTYGVTTDYEYSAEHNRHRIEVWSGAFMSTWYATGLSLPNRDGYMLTDYNGDKIRVTCPAPRTSDNYIEVDDAISDALTTRYASNGSVVVGA